MLRHYERYALFFAPAQGGVLARLGAAWLGRDAGTGARFAPPEAAADLPRPHAEITATPRRYGLHGTLKPPMRLAPGCGAEALARAAQALADCYAPVSPGRLRVARLGHFLALVPEVQPHALSALAAAVVEALDGFRAPPAADELARRRAAGLTRAQEHMLLRWGSPRVMDEFRFHITLTGPLEAAEIAPVTRVAEAHFAPALARAPVMSSLALFGEDGDGVFLLVRRLPLRG